MGLFDNILRGKVKIPLAISHIVAKKFGYKTTYITKHIKAVIEDLKELEVVETIAPKVQEEERKRAFKWQADFIAAFNAMETVGIETQTGEVVETIAAIVEDSPHITIRRSVEIMELLTHLLHCRKVCQSEKLMGKVRLLGI